MRPGLISQAKCTMDLRRARIHRSVCLRAHIIQQSRNPTKRHCLRDQLGCLPVSRQRSVRELKERYFTYPTKVTMSDIFTMQELDSKGRLMQLTNNAQNNRWYTMATGEWPETDLLTSLFTRTRNSLPCPLACSAYCLAVPFSIHSETIVGWGPKHSTSIPMNGRICL